MRHFRYGGGWYGRDTKEPVSGTAPTSPVSPSTALGGYSEGSGTRLLLRAILDALSRRYEMQVFSEKDPQIRQKDLTNCYRCGIMGALLGILG